MKSPTNNILLALWLATTATATTQVRQEPAIKIKAPKPAVEKFRGEVLNFTPVAITVRNPKNTTLVRTFQFSPKLEGKLANHYMENGDRVTVHFLKGSDTAVKLQGKIRKQGAPLLPRIR